MKKTQDTSETWPREIKGENGLTVRLYRQISGERAAYTLSYYARDGKRQRVVSSDLVALESRAQEILADLAKGTPIDKSPMTAAEREEVGLSREALKATGATLLVCAKHFAKAVEILGADLVIEAARDYARRNMHKLQPKPVSEVVTECLAQREKVGRDAKYRRILKGYLDAFSASCPGANIADVCERTIAAFLDGLDLAPRTVNNHRAGLRILFNFAKSKKYLPKDWSEMDAIGMLDDEGGEIEIYTPKELAALLTHAEDELIPFLAIGAFAGLRSAEIMRLDWSEINFETGYITIGKKKAKTRSRRVVEITPALRAWLKNHTEKSGPVVTALEHRIYMGLLPRACKAAGVASKHNALRHSFISYRVALTGDVNRTSLEAGNSPEIIFRNYRELVTAKAAALWFAITPGCNLAELDNKLAPMASAA